MRLMQNYRERRDANLALAAIQIERVRWYGERAEESLRDGR